MNTTQILALANAEHSTGDSSHFDTYCERAYYLAGIVSTTVLHGPPSLTTEDVRDLGEALWRARVEAGQNAAMLRTWQQLREAVDEILGSIELVIPVRRQLPTAGPSFEDTFLAPF